MFDKILIANRGEIACRVIRTCREMGVATVAVYSSADRNSRHTEMADEAVRIGAAPSSESYLNIPAIIEAAQQTGAQAIHPGYGFLSENAEFADACAAGGLVFIGPSADAIRAMGSKLEAKCIMAEAGVPVLPGGTAPDQDEAALTASAEAVGYPVMVKPAAGGGGRGMRIVREADNLPEALASARREAISSFGDELLMIEKYLDNPRHIEVQIFGDSHDNVIHLLERDCSAQRRHQKVIEEAPAPGLNDDIRERLFEASIAAAKAVDYAGAGTVEFLLDGNGDVWFIEMNTRLQVEHPVTEAVTGIDLVEWQLRVASGEALPVSQDDIACTGHAIEARLYAEDPANDFTPGTGRIGWMEFPPENDFLRIDTGVREGDEVTVHYDPMIAKFISVAADRASACEVMSQALADVRIAGPATNEVFLRAIVDHHEFRVGGFDTGFIARNIHKLAPAAETVPGGLLAVAALAEFTRPVINPDSSPWVAQSGWRLGGATGRKIVLGKEGERVSFSLSATGLNLDGNNLSVSGAWSAPNCFEANANGLPVTANVVRDGSRLFLFVEERRFVIEIDDPLVGRAVAAGDASSLFAAMPGVVVAVHVEDGAEVAAGTPLMAVEAMKVEHTIRAPWDGRVTDVNFAVGDRVSEGQELVSFDPM